VALFRLIEGDSGKIIIDGLDISKIGLNKLRSGETVHSQVCLTPDGAPLR